MNEVVGEVTRKTIELGDNKISGTWKLPGKSKYPSEEKFEVNFPNIIWLNFVYRRKNTRSLNVLIKKMCVYLCVK